MVKFALVRMRHSPDRAHQPYMPLQNKHPARVASIHAQKRSLLIPKMPSRTKQAPTPASALEQLQNSNSLKIVAIAETLSPKELAQSARKRSSAASEDSEQNGDTHPAALAADLLHYKVCYLFVVVAK
jgi:hypothetical protein